MEKMKIIKTSKFLLGVIVLSSVVSSAQTVNTGDLYITSGTIMSTIQELNNTTTAALINDGALYLYSDYNNDGVVEFTNGSKTGTTFMKGKKGYQKISGSVPMMWNNAEFDNSNVQPAFRLSNEIRISGKAVFQNGIIDDDDYQGLVVFEEGVSLDKVRNESHVDGVVRKNGHNAFIYPIGDSGYYRYARISAPGKSEDAFTGKYFFKDSDIDYSHSTKSNEISIIDNAEYWTLDKTAGEDNVFLTLSWSEDTTPGTIYASPYEEIHIVHWDNTLKKWVDLGGAVNIAAKEVSMVLAPIESYGVFTLARVKSSLSDLIVYNAVSPNEDGMNDYFKIEGIENYKKNSVEIYNRWGVKVFESSGYDNVVNVFKGFSEGRATVKTGDKLPVGTYFYIINAENETAGKSFKKSGYLYLSY